MTYNGECLHVYKSEHLDIESLPMTRANEFPSAIHKALAMGALSAWSAGTLRQGLLHIVCSC